MTVFSGPSTRGEEAHNDAFRKNIMDLEDKRNTQLPTSVGTMLGDHMFLDAEKMTEVYDGSHWNIKTIQFPGFALKLPIAPATAP